MYEGYTNYPTWALAQWVHKEVANGEYFAEITHPIYQAYLNAPEDGIKALADSIRNVVEDNLPDIQDQYYGHMYSNTLRHAVEAIDYEQISAELLKFDEADQPKPEE